MTPATKFVLGAFAFLIGGGLVVSSLSPARPMPKGPLVERTTAALPILASTMPAFEGIMRWWNTPDNAPLTPETLKGKVVVIDFWTYSCINCIRTYPFVRAMHERYAKDGLVIVGVHTPEFAFEADPGNVDREIAKNGLRFPIALDPEYRTWNAYENRYWPAKYIFDRQGKLRFTHFGEGAYEETEQAIRDLLAEGDGLDLGPMADVADREFRAQTPETYFGLDRGAELMGRPGPAGQDVRLVASPRVDPDRWTASGTWRFEREYVEARSAGSTFRFNVQGRKLHMVMGSSDGSPRKVKVYVDGMQTGTIAVTGSTLYDIADLDGRHTVELRFEDAGVRLFAATFS